MNKWLWLMFMLLGSEGLWAGPGPGTGRIESVTVATRAEHNRQVKIFYRIPKNYNPEGKGLYRVLVYFGGRNCGGEAQAKGQLGFDRWADENDVFLVGAGFKDDEYWHPEKWSGKALTDGLALIKKKYRICDDKLMYYGFSGGSQSANLFPAWKPSRCVAWVSHACGVWHKPSEKMVRTPGLVTCGDADTGRYILSRRFVEESRQKGVPIIWKSYPNTPHEVPPDSVKLAMAFLSYHNRRNLADLRAPGALVNRGKDKIMFVGDDQ